MALVVATYVAGAVVLVLASLPFFAMCYFTEPLKPV